MYYIVPERIGSSVEIDIEFSEFIRKQFPEQAYLQSDGLVGFRPSIETEGYMLGNPEYPVAKYREMICDTVKDNLLTIITAKTGTGKSTNVPQYLFETGLYDRVVITQPRVIAARRLQEYVSENLTDSLNDPEHQLAGFRTAVEGNSSDENTILYVTDGLQLMHEISQNGIAKDQVLVIDEYHERSSNMDALVAIAVKYGIRTVIMSATLDAENISRHYAGAMNSEVPVIEVIGEQYAVEERESDDLYGEVVTMAKAGKNILVFLPGRKEINSAIGRLSKFVPDSYTLLALHGDQTPDEQQKAMDTYAGGKIIFSTAVGQTSITFDGIDCVIDCGYERTMILGEGGVRTLATQPSSRATSDQRKGRVGRMQEGDTYIRAQLPSLPSLPSISEQVAYDVPEIRRMHLDDLQLKLAAFGNSFDSLPFFQSPDEDEVIRTRERLVRLGMLKDLGRVALNGYEITSQGEKAARLALDVNSARMVLESRKYGPGVELMMMAATAVQQLNGITMTVKGMENWRSLTKETRSDMIANIDFMIGSMRRTEEERQGKNIVNLRYAKAMRAFMNLAEKRDLDVYDLQIPNAEQREQLLRCIVAGTDELFIAQGQMYRDYRGKKRQTLASTTLGQGSELMIGTPFNLQQARSKKIATHTLISAGTNVTMDMLRETIPERITTSIDSLYLDKDGTPRTEETVFFDGYPTKHRISGIAEAGPQLQKFIIDQIFSNNKIDSVLPPNITKARQSISEFKKLQHRTEEYLGVDYSVQQIIETMIKQTDYTSLSLEEIDPFIDQEAVSHIVPDDIRNEILDGSPDTVTITTQGRELEFEVTYFENKAHLTVPERYYELLPFTIGNAHRLSVRPHSKAPYVGLENARDAYASANSRPSRDQRRGASAKDSAMDRSMNASELRDKPRSSSPVIPRFQPYRHNAAPRAY